MATTSRVGEGEAPFIYSSMLVRNLPTCEGWKAEWRKKPCGWLPFNSCDYSWTCSQSFFCLELQVEEPSGSILSRWSDDVTKKASAKNFNAVSHNRARPEVLFSNLKHGGPWRSKGSVYLYVSCCCKTCGSFQTDNAGVLELTERRRHFPSLGETLQCQKS